MFVVTDLLALQDPESDGNGKAIMAWVIVIVNAISISLYPMYKFFNAWSESEEINFSFVKETLFKFFEFFMGTQLAASLLAKCGCLRKFPNRVCPVLQLDILEHHTSGLREAAGAYSQKYPPQWRSIVNVLRL